MSLYYFNPYSDAIRVICESEIPSVRESKKIQVILEDTNSPVTTKYVEKLYDSVISKSHIDFDNIPLSKGDITTYKGYANMVEILNIIMKLATEQKSTSVISYVTTVQNAIRHMTLLKTEYSNGFRIKNDYVMLEYNTYVYTIIQAVSTILYEFVDYVKAPDKKVIEITLKNTKYRADTFYIDQLTKFNTVNEKMNYKKFLQSVLHGGNNNFIGTAEAVGIGAVLVVALAIVPITRELIYRFYNVRSNISDCLAQQAYFLEMNKSVVEANNDFNAAKKESIIMKQEKLKVVLLKLSDKLRVSNIKNMNSSKKAIQDDNKLLTIDNIRKEVDNSPLELM